MSSQGGGSIMMAIPPALLDLLNLHAGVTVGMVIEGERLVVQPRPRPGYSLDELLSQCHSASPLTKEDRGWLHNVPLGRER